MQILGILVQKDNGKISFIRVEEDSGLSIVPNEVPDLSTGSGLVDNPTPAEVKYRQAVKVKEANVDNILDKYKEE